ncbi:hypothetical protein NDU88_001612 [Pleurodeles waltl]|uniref:Uncharacterized protein n=1 Tax=Pleurodeles waltl TaxID=8319 RepID=A0AAV7R8H9_PLEWA|nr:hypothetical protein NDU88_001612 [Pleurodeles waltl]
MQTVFSKFRSTSSGPFQNKLEIRKMRVSSQTCRNRLPRPISEEELGASKSSPAIQPSPRSRGEQSAAAATGPQGAVPPAV